MKLLGRRRKFRDGDYAHEHKHRKQDRRGRSSRNRNKARRFFRSHARRYASQKLSNEFATTIAIVLAGVGVYSTRLSTGSGEILQRTSQFEDLSSSLLVLAQRCLRQFLRLQ